MTKQNRHLGRAIRKLQASKTPAQSLEILARLEKRDPKTFKKLQEM